MANEFYDGIMQGLNEALDVVQGKIRPASVRRMSVATVKEFSPAEIKQIRLKARMTQSIFAACIGVSLKSVEAWEGGRSKPDGAARRTLGLLEADPQYMDKLAVISRCQ